MKFTFNYIEDQYIQIKDLGYRFFDCNSAIEQIDANGKLPEHSVVNRVDVDVSLTRARRLGEIFHKHQIPASFFIRLHASEYNPLSFENFAIIRELDSMGFEIGYHSEIMDCAAIWQEDPSDVLRRDLSVLSAMLGKPVAGIASHGGLTGINNLDFWAGRSALDYGARYEAYDDELFGTGIYVSDSEWTRWKSYKDGVRIEGALLGPADYAKAKVDKIYLLVHSDTYFDRHIYER